jgi:hypothetical protein
MRPFTALIRPIRAWLGYLGSCEFTGGPTPNEIQALDSDPGARDAGAESLRPWVVVGEGGRWGAARTPEFNPCVLTSFAGGGGFGGAVGRGEAWWPGRYLQHACQLRKVHSWARRATTSQLRGVGAQDIYYLHGPDPALMRIWGIGRLAQACKIIAWNRIRTDPCRLFSTKNRWSATVSTTCRFHRYAPTAWGSCDALARSQPRGLLSARPAREIRDGS